MGHAGALRTGWRWTMDEDAASLHQHWLWQTLLHTPLRFTYVRPDRLHLTPARVLVT